MTNDELILMGCGDVGPVHEPIETYSVLARATLASADVRCAQVERVYSTRGSLQLHAGVGHSRVKPHMAAVFSDCGFNVVSLASNHAMDCRRPRRRRPRPPSGRNVMVRSWIRAIRAFRTEATRSAA